MDFSHVSNNPLHLFQKWFFEAEETDAVDEANAMSLTTLGDDGFPRARVVLLKDFSEEGFVFFTNYNSEKGKSILNHSKVGLSFYWPSLERQIIIKGEAEKLLAEKSDQYFDSRPRGSQIELMFHLKVKLSPIENFWKICNLLLRKSLKILKSLVLILGWNISATLRN